MGRVLTPSGCPPRYAVLNASEVMDSTMHNTTPLADIDAAPDPARPTVQVPDEAQERATRWVAHITSIVGAACLLAALVYWAWHPGHLRTVLALLIVAMFAAILHSYTFEDG